jgi:hypothetical protein
MKCVKASFDTTSSGDPNFSKDDNRILKEEAEKWKALGRFITRGTSRIVAN